MTNPMDRLLLFPDTAKIENDSLMIAGQDLAALAEIHGTPLYLYDRATMDAAVLRYRRALKASYPGASSITYAGKAFLCKAVVQWTRQHRVWLDCTSEGEIAVAQAGEMPRESIVAHGTNKSASGLRSALRGAGTVVIDNLTELERIGALFKAESPASKETRPFPNLWLRLQPGVTVDTHHAHTQTGHAESKFGMMPTEILTAAQTANALGLPLNGLHFHLGSNFRETSPVVSAIELALDLVREIRLPESWHFCPGGGWGVAYHEDELPQPDTEKYVRAIAQCVVKRSRANGLALPILHLEPGRSLVARAGVAVYRVGSIKRHVNRIWVLIDGGMADNPRHALYGSRYSCLPARGVGRALKETVSIGGPYCESGDVIIEDLRMPQIEAGELIAIPVSGAYHLSMASNYNGALRPAALWLEKGTARLIIRRETPDELLQRDLSAI